MISRRQLLAGLAATAAAAPYRARAEAILTDDGLLRQPWFIDSLLELPDDLAAATANKKRFAILWELKGCPYCKTMHEVNFGKPEIETFIKDRFDILQLNFIGAREVTDFDGQKLSEKRLAAKYGVRGTPTFQFFPDDPAVLIGKKPWDREVARIHGYVEPAPFLGTFRYVAERAYEKGSLADFPEGGELARVSLRRHARFQSVILRCSRSEPRRIDGRFILRGALAPLTRTSG